MPKDLPGAGEYAPMSHPRRGSWSVQGCLLKRRGEAGVLLVLFLRKGDLERVRMEPEQEEEPLVLFLRRGDRRRG